MGFCDCYIIMPVGDKDYGKTTFLQEAYALAHDGKMKIGDYSVLAGKKVGDSEGNHKDEGDWTWDNLKMSLRAKGKIPTTDKNEDIFAYFVVKHMSTNEEVLWIFRDNPGEILSQPPSDSKLRAFVREVDAFLFFSYPYAFSQIKHQWDSVSERLLKNMKTDFNKEASGSSSTNDDMYNKTYNLLDVTKSDLNNKAGMFVLTMTDKLLEKDNSGRTVIDDLEFENIHISSHSPMFQTGKPFNLRNYYQCAFETAYLLSDEEQFYKQFMSLNDTWKLGTTAISALRNHTQKINYVFGWLIVCLLESDGDGRHFQKPLYEQSADDFRQNPLY
ncbi:MAG: hypothetical protein IIY93_00025 [Clostridia bacterium]|nr:hypothetical protein [Clostridia bacterium]